jgi:leucyl aminopeptidase
MKILSLQDAPRGTSHITLIPGPISKFTTLGDITRLEVGLGSDEAVAKKPFSQRKVTLLLRKMVTLAKQYKLKGFVISWSDLRRVADKNISDKKLGEIAAIAWGMADFDFNVYKKEPAGGFDIVEDIFVIDTPKPARDGILRGEQIATEINGCRALSNTPGGDMTPKLLADLARIIAKGTKVKVEVLGKKEMEKEGMGAVLGMAKGSDEEPQFIVMEYHGAPEQKTECSCRQRRHV